MKENDIRNKNLSIPFTTEQEIQEESSDSKTNVYVELRRDRTVISMRIKPELKETLKRFCKANGLSLCHVFEMLTTAYLYGVNQQIEFVNKSPTINLTVVREVKRIRRYSKEYEDVEVEVVGREGFCVICGLKADFRAFKKVDEKTTSTVYYCRMHFDKKSVDGYKLLSEVSF